MSLTVTAPAGAHFEYDEVKTARGTETLGEVPLLTWDDIDAARDFYGVEGMCDILNGTSVRVSAQGIARRLKAQGKTDDEIAEAQIAFRPGKRAGGTSTPKSRAATAAKAAAEKTDGDLIAKLLQKIAAGGLSAEDVASLVD